MTRKSKRNNCEDSDSDIDISIIEEEFDLDSKIQKYAPINHIDYFDHICNIYDSLSDFTNDQSLYLLDRGRFENFCDFIYKNVPHIH